MIWFTSDTHYWHKNVIKYCNRPFSSVEEMNETLISNYNNVVSQEDTVYFLGDVIFGGTTKARAIIERLNGEKHLIIGNHDVVNRAEKWLKLGFKTAVHSMKLGNFNLSHFPYAGFEADERHFEHRLKDEGDWLFHGHVHQHWKQKDRMINVGVDIWDFYPVSLPDLLDIVVGEL